MSEVDTTTTAARAYLATLRRDSFTLLRPRLIDDGAGGQRPDPAGPQQIGPLSGHFWRLSGRELIEAAQLRQRGEYRLAASVALTDPDTDDPLTIQETDQVEVDGRVYNIVWLPPVAALDLRCIVGLEEASV